VGYARLAREEFAWARHSFEEALVLEPEHEDALAGSARRCSSSGSRRRRCAASAAPWSWVRRRPGPDAPDRPRAVPRGVAP
jgi:hypothetical protein